MCTMYAILVETTSVLIQLRRKIATGQLRGVRLFPMERANGRSRAFWPFTLEVAKIKYVRAQGQRGEKRSILFDLLLLPVEMVTCLPDTCRVGEIHIYYINNNSNTFLDII